MNENVGIYTEYNIAYTNIKRFEDLCGFLIPNFWERFPESEATIIVIM